MDNKKKQKRRRQGNIAQTLIILTMTGTIAFGGYTFNEHKSDCELKLQEKVKLIEELEQKHQEHERSISRASANIEIIENAVNELTNENDILRQEKEQLNREKNELQEKVNNLEKELSSRTFSLNASSYTAHCKPITIDGKSYKGCSGVTATGVNVKNTVYYNGLRIVATDPKVIPLRSILRLYYNDGTTEEVIAMDTGGYIKGNKIDILVKDEKTAEKFGRQTIKAVVLKWG